MGNAAIDAKNSGKEFLFAFEVEIGTFYMNSRANQICGNVFFVERKNNQF